MDDQVRNFILWCLENRSIRPTAKNLLESDFMNDTTSENNNKYCEISEVARVKVPKKEKKFNPIKNMLPEIEEEETPINNDMEIKTQNQVKVPNQTAHLNFQALANENDSGEAKTP